MSPVTKASMGGKGWLEQNQRELIFIKNKIEISIQSSVPFFNMFHLILQPINVQPIVTHKIDLLKVNDLYGLYLSMFRQVNIVCLPEP